MKGLLNCEGGSQEVAPFHSPLPPVEIEIEIEMAVSVSKSQSGGDLHL